ncbi:hypothetical protein [Mesomycoplasma ovipneumoniae]|uniref:hypothetical protein n=1 Tax=Mesomycoplasma ovipneumoniae TaxID=29562 RepID=UPI00311AE271
MLVLVLNLTAATGRVHFSNFIPSWIKYGLEFLQNLSFQEEDYKKVYFSSWFVFPYLLVHLFQPAVGFNFSSSFTISVPSPVVVISASPTTSLSDEFIILARA